ncbi:hypothetical protein Tco_1350245 [Tanacetum coccineum]
MPGAAITYFHGNNARRYHNRQGTNQSPSAPTTDSHGNNVDKHCNRQAIPLEYMHLGAYNQVLHRVLNTDGDIGTIDGQDSYNNVKIQDIEEQGYDLTHYLRLKMHLQIRRVHDLRSARDREHTKVLELEAEISKQKQLITESEKRFAFLEQNYLKDAITSVRIQNDGFKAENVNLKQHYDELSKANTHSRTAYTEKLSALTTQHIKLQAQVTGTTSSGPSTSETPKVLAP